MNVRKPEQTAALELRKAEDDGIPPYDPPPLIHQPVVAVSLILIAATAVQTGAYLINTRVLAETGGIGSVPPPSILASSELFDRFSSAIEGIHVAGVPAARLLFGVMLTSTILSTIGWYVVARKMLGRGWGLWCGLLWAAHPLFAFVAQRPSRLALNLVLVSIAWALMIWWSRSRRRRVGLAAGLAAGLAGLASPAMGAALVLALFPLFLAGRMNRKSSESLLLVCLGAALPAVVAWATSSISSPAGSLSQDLMGAVEADGSPVARAVQLKSMDSRADSGRPLRALADEFVTSPGPVLLWLMARAWRTLSATADGHFQRTLFAIQLGVLLPALWGVGVCLKVPYWRWPAIASTVLLATYWMVVAVAEPLARNLAPVWAVIVLFACVGVADAYMRISGRRLEFPAVAT